MIKNSSYIRFINPFQIGLLQKLQEKFPKLKTVPNLLFFALREYFEQEKEIARLKRIIEYKQAKIEKMQEGN